MEAVNGGDTAWVLTSTALVLVMTPALAFFYGGMVRKKNVLSTLNLSFVLVALIGAQWVLYGYSLAFGPDVAGLVGTLRFLGFAGVGSEPSRYAPTIPHIAFAAFQMMFAIITPALITGARIGIRTHRPAAFGARDVHVRRLQEGQRHDGAGDAPGNLAGHATGLGRAIGRNGALMGQLARLDQDFEGCQEAYHTLGSHIGHAQARYSEIDARLSRFGDRLSALSAGQDHDAGTKNPDNAAIH